MKPPSHWTLFMRITHKGLSNNRDSDREDRDYYTTPSGTIYVYYPGVDSYCVSSLNHSCNQDYIMELSIRWAANPDSRLEITQEEWARCSNRR